MLEFMPLDLNDLTSVQNFVIQFTKKYQKVDTLINNAGIMMLPQRQETA